MRRRLMPVSALVFGMFKVLYLTVDPPAVQEGKKLVVIGSSFISMELIVAVQKRNLASIDVIGMESYPFEAVLGKEVGAALKKVRMCEYMSDLTSSFLSP